MLGWRNCDKIRISLIASLRSFFESCPTFYCKRKICGKWQSPNTDNFLHHKVFVGLFVFYQNSATKTPFTNDADALVFLHLALRLT